MRHSVYFLLIAFLMQVGTNVSAQTFLSNKLENAASVLGIDKKIDTLSAGKTIKLLTKDDRKIVVRVGMANMVEHIGVPLFNEQMRMLMPSPVYDFLEFAVLDKKYRLNSNTLNLSKVIFKRGNWDTLLRECLDECDCSIENKDDKLYIVTWQRNGNDVAVVGIPIEYELLNNDTRRNMEKSFIRNIEQWKSGSFQRLTTTVAEDELKIYGTDGLFVLQGESYLIDELNQNTYYVFKTIKEFADTVIHNRPVRMSLETVQPTLLVDQEHSAESLANLMLSEDASAPDVDVTLDFHLSNYHRKQVSIPLYQLKGYLKSLGCNLYFASSGTKADVARGMLLVCNKAKGYNHLLSVSIPISSLTDNTPNIAAAVYLYIPPIEKSKLFGKVPVKKSGVKVN